MRPHPSTHHTATTGFWTKLVRTLTLLGAIGVLTASILIFIKLERLHASNDIGSGPNKSLNIESTFRDDQGAPRQKQQNPISADSTKDRSANSLDQVKR